MSAPLVIAGGSLAALRTAEALRRSGWQEEILVLGDERRMPYNRPPLSKDLLAGRTEADALAFPLREVVADVRWRTGTAVVALDVARRAVRTADGDVVAYGILVVATGVRARRLPAEPGAPGRYALRTAEDALALRARLVPGTRVVILGSGLVGCEVAATARSAGCEVTVVSRSPEPLQRVLGTALGGRMRRRHEEAGVAFVHSPAVAVDPALPRIRLADGRTVSGDVLVEAIGSEPNTRWLDPARFRPGRSVPTDHALRALGADGHVVPRVFAVGDVASAPSPLDGHRPRSVQHWNMPGEMAKRAAEAICAKAAGDPGPALARPFAPVPSFWTDQYELHLLSYGLPALGDSCVLLHGDPEGECVYGYFRGPQLVGVCGLGLRSKVLAYRAEIQATMAAARSA